MNELLPPGDVPPSDPAPAPKPRATGRIVCEFCECQLAPSGDVLARGDAAKKYLDLEDRLKAANARLDTAAETITELRASLAEATKPAAKRGMFD